MLQFTSVVLQKGVIIRVKSKLSHDDHPENVFAMSLQHSFAACQMLTYIVCTF